MPPWRAVPGYGDFVDASRLSRRELATPRPLGRRRGAGGRSGRQPRPPAFPEGWQLGPPDLVVTMAEAFAVPADGGDVFRSFVLPLPLDRDGPVAAVEFRPGNRRVVHHARFFVDPTPDCRRCDAVEPGPGFALRRTQRHPQARARGLGPRSDPAAPPARRRQDRARGRTSSS